MSARQRERHRAEACDRIWEAEAIEDGRMGPSGSAPFERHLAVCAECRSEVDSLRALRAAMGTLPQPSLTELERRRSRQTLLRAADARIVGRGEKRRGWLWPALGAAAALALVLALVWRLRGGGERPIVAIGRAPSAEIAGADGARWTERVEGSSRLVRLQEGEVSFHVEHVAPDARFAVELPDGELEVRGTRFRVDVRDGRTLSVEVSEGAVELRVAGYRGVIPANGSWHAPPSRVSSSSLADSPVPATSPPSESAEPSARTSAPPETPHEPSAAPSSAPPSPGERFAEAMTAFTRGAYGQADSLFAGFISDFPRDSRAEDAMYLRAEARMRAGDAAGAAAMARAYLAAFPKGFRRPEAERIAGVAGPAPASSALPR